MPRVPRYEGGVREEGFQPGSVSTQAPIEAFGGGREVDRAFSAGRGIIDDAQKLLIEEKRKADDVGSQEDYAAAATKKNALLYDPKSGAMNRRGKDALGTAGEYSEQFDKWAGEYEKGLPNEERRRMFNRIRTRERLELTGSLERHTFGEMKSFDDQTTESGLAVAAEDAVLNYQTPGKVQQNIDLQKAIITSHAARNGLPAEWVKLKTEGAASKTHSAVINRMLNNGQDRLAKEYFDANKAQITGPDASSMEKVLEEGTFRGESQRKTDDIIAKNTERKDALEATRSIEDPKLRDEVEKRVNSFFNQKKVVDAEQEERITQEATDIVEKTKDFDKIPAATVSELPLSMRTSLRRYADDLREGKKPATSWDTYYDLKTQASSASTQEKFLRTNLMAFRTQMADAEFKELVDIQTSLRAKDGKADKELEGYRTSAQIVNDALASAGIDPTPKPGKAEAEQVALFRRSVDEQIMVQQRQTGKKATNDDVQRIVDNLMVKGTVPGSGFLGFFQTKKRAFELKPGESIAIDKKDIPRGEVAKIEDALRRAGRPVTDDMVLELYNRKLQQGRQ